MQLLPSPFPEQFPVERLLSLDDGPMFGPRSAYVEAAWLPVLGPTSTWLYRRLGTLLEVRPDGFTVTLTKLEEELGLGPSSELPSAAAGAIRRLVNFDAAMWFQNNLLVRMELPALSPAFLRWLTPELLEVEERLRLAETEV